MVPRFWDGILEIFGTGFRQSWTVWGLVVILELRSPGFVVCFDVTVIQRRMEKKKVYGCEGAESFPVLYGSEIWAILCFIARKINNMLLCLKIMLICTCLMY